MKYGIYCNNFCFYKYKEYIGIYINLVEETFAYDKYEKRAKARRN
jgi:hypothetical protein